MPRMNSSRRTSSGVPRHQRPPAAITAALCSVLIILGFGVSLSPAAAAPVLTADTAGVEPGVVRIDTELRFQGAIGAGTGVVVSPDGIVLTNNHVIRGATNITATNVGNGQTYPVDVLGYDRKSDIAVLQLRGASDLPVAPTGDSTGVHVGDLLTAVGFPDGGALARASGTVRALGQRIVADDDLTGSSEELSDLIDFNANIQPGDSGGPLVDPSGHVVGIVTAASQTYQMKSTGGFAIPLSRALPIADAIRSDDPAGSIHVGPTAILGIGVGEARSSAGVPVQGVLRGSAAEQAGITGGDVISAIDAAPIADATALTDVLDQHTPGDTITATLINRRGTSRDTAVTLAPGPPN